ncbi:glycosyltransferase family 2 protein [Limnofasciculus baicalensis]|uniref:Glycosyltransferase n=1 Tax=Limnofasciculus baicalensis BBK-W-15 TaxID=2699891 RepID=A0AAE3KNB9_9CYAN|nr:glycosyltransferase family 2 protein [Limnofasciculus baicalensis]MCP2729661.1 glycosyltransferase [Limnofasciculus baicalensis BBK-W-15]
MTTISCIIVSYNNGIFLKESILSVVNQTKPVDEIIIADDGSTDGSRDLITSLAQEYSQIQPIFREKNLGVTLNRDLAIRAATSELITTLDGDDWYSPQKIEREYFALENNLESIAYSDVNLTDIDGGISRYLDLSDFSSFDIKQRVNWTISHVTEIPRDMLFPKKLYLEVGGLRHNLDKYEDWELKIRLAAYPTPWIHSGIVGVNYRSTDSGLSKTNPIIHAKYQYQILISNYDLLKDNIGEMGFWLAMAKVTRRAAKSLFGIRSKLKKLRSSGK